MSQQPNREEAIVDSILDLPPQERAACLDQACGSDTPLRQRVEGLLRLHQGVEVFDRQPAIRNGTLGPAGQMMEWPGQRIARYKLLEKIGEGGCGVVYVAEQEEPVRRRVALKVIKLGMPRCEPVKSCLAMIGLLTTW
jgi:hypothetical protein